MKKKILIMILAIGLGLLSIGETFAVESTIGICGDRIRQSFSYNEKRINAIIDQAFKLVKQNLNLDLESKAWPVSFNILDDSVSDRNYHQGKDAPMFFLPTSGTIIIKTDTFLKKIYSDTEISNLLAHELTHFYLKCAGYSELIPLWFNEGLALQNNPLNCYGPVAATIPKEFYTSFKSTSEHYNMAQHVVKDWIGSDKGKVLRFLTVLEKSQGCHSFDDVYNAFSVHS